MNTPPATPDELLEIAAGAMGRSNLPFAEVICRMVQDVRKDDARAQQIIERIANQLGLDQPPPAPGVELFLLIKAWGFGFWSDVDHVLGGLLLAEMTGRIPVVHWGANSLFSDNPFQNAFEHFFEPVSKYSINDLANAAWSFFPRKWSAANLRSENVNKFGGLYSRAAGIYFLNRPERVAVADFYLPIIGLVPWIRPGHPMHGKSVAQIYRDLFSRYLRPVPMVQQQIDQFYEQHLAGRPFIAAHLRGSDKRSELADLDEINASYFQHVDAMAPDPAWRIFLLTDAQAVADAFHARYGDRLVLTDSERTSDSTGTHYKPASASQKSRRGVDVMVDTYVAARADKFVGNGASNVSCMVEHLKNWRQEDFRLLVPSIHYVRDAMLHQW